MIDFNVLGADLDEAGLESWKHSLPAVLQSRFAPDAHGNLPQWQAVLESLPVPRDIDLHLDTERTGGDSEALSPAQRSHIREQLMQLRPWRKGPFNLCGVAVDSEWRSDFKWRRIKPAIAPLTGRKILDVGCGNGYYALRMAGAGARLVIGVDPTLLFVCQYLAIQKLLQIRRVHVLPLRLHEIPGPAPVFDTTFSMGVLYHQRNPQEHLRQLLATLRPEGELVLETLVIPGDGIDILEPDDRYARMRNVWRLPTVPALLGWLQEAGFKDSRIADVSTTTGEEQRKTEWMQFESLAEALHQDDPRLTIEGHPAPTRAVVICNAPA